MKKTIFILASFIVVMMLFISCRKENSCKECINGNHLPVANAGNDAVITLPMDSILLDGSSSSDPDGKISAWQWTKISGPSSFAIFSSASSKAVAKNLIGGVYQFELKVTDDKGAFAKDTVMITVNAVAPINHAPLANAGNDTTITLPANTANLDGSKSTDPDNNITSYQWAKINGPSSFAITNASAITTQVNNLVEGTYLFELKVTDAGGLYAKDTILIKVNGYLSLTINWQKTLGGSGSEIANSIQSTADGGYIVAGSTNSNNGDVTGWHQGFGCYEDCFHQRICNDAFSDALIVKLNSSGTVQWQKTLGGSGADLLFSIQPTSDGGYISAGFTYSNDGDVSGYHSGEGADAWIVKLSNSGAIQWQKILGGTNCDYAQSILSTSDGGYIVVGHAESSDGDVTGTHGLHDVWVVKLNSVGAIQWQKVLGGSKDDYGQFIQSTADGGYIVSGYTSSNDGDVAGNHGGTDAWIVKLNGNGVIQWQKTLGGTTDDNAQCVQATADGGYIVAGFASSYSGDVTGNNGGQDVWIVKLNSTGTIQWQKTLGGANNDNAKSIQLTTDGGYIIAGCSNSDNGYVTGWHGGEDAWIVKLNSSGNLQWTKALGGSGNDNARSIQPTADGGYILAGYTYSTNGDLTGISNHGNGDVWIVKLKQQ